MSQPSIRSHRDLNVWQNGMTIAEGVYALTTNFPKHEIYGLTSQIRRAAVSVPANIAEGNARNSTKDYLRFLSIAIGSLAEVETFVELSQRLPYGTPSQLASLVEMIAEERRMLRGLQRSLEAKLEVHSQSAGPRPEGNLRPPTSDL